MSNSVQAYSQNVATLSDAELETLSAEMEDAFIVAGHDGDSQWTDDEAETRYYAMCSELRRRHPRPPGPLDSFMELCARSVLSSFAASNTFAREIDAEILPSVGKIGNTLTIRKPYRFNQ